MDKRLFKARCTIESEEEVNSGNIKAIQTFYAKAKWLLILK